MIELTCDYCETEAIIFVGPLSPDEKSKCYCVGHYLSRHFEITDYIFSSGEDDKR